MERVGFETRNHSPAHPAPLLSAQDLGQVAFHRPPPGQPGYDEQDVDTFLDRIEETLRGRDDVTEEQVRRKRFRPARPGYHAAEVDVFMDLVAETLKSTPQRRQAAAPAHGAHATTTGMRPAPQLTPQDVRGVRFHKPRPGNRGYHEGEIDAFLVRIERTLSGRDVLTAREVQDVEFSYAPTGRVGYDEEDVDTFLDLVVVTLERNPLPPPVRPRPGPGSRPLTARDVRTVAFGKPPRGRRGYQESQVDKFLDRVENALLGQDDLSARDVREIRFSRPVFGRRGYDETEVDAFLARVERQLSDSPAPGALPAITSWKQLRAVRIPSARPDQRGYRTSQVDRALEEIGIALDGMVGATSSEVMATRFALAMTEGQGYDRAFVDELLPLLAAELRRRDR
ncbi:hypothetical protein GCM10022243_20930 [Saccharothrix violaceirubra]|uniref:Cell wall synthesis protein Wag31 n=1 Tax=Saccharothrix violaceirubra TaxID=413306 RepID=A0A7W7WZ22_9PSEU|nr:DivIVA domain-containing protein [Saccharothrix violaceirubra]MBB4968566.1 DivIVA domain-containing protein [Saccharothrix violaceirubra]